MTSLHLCRRPGFNLFLTACFLGTGLLLTTDADARRAGKKAGWSTSASKSTKDAPRKRLFSRSSPRVQRVAATNPSRVARAHAFDVAIPSTTQTQPPARSAKRSGLLAKLFGPIEDEGRSLTSVTRTSVPPKPQLAPGQPNAYQAAPKIDHSLIASSPKSQSSVTVNIARQRAYVYIGGQLAVDTPISTARSGKYTPRGTFRIGERVHTGKISNLYHVEMPRWMRLGSTPFGMHAGYLPGYPASAGCIRMPYAAADAVYKATGYGTTVRITSG